MVEAMSQAGHQSISHTQASVCMLHAASAPGDGVHVVTTTEAKLPPFLRAGLLRSLLLLLRLELGWQEVTKVHARAAL